MKTKVYSAKNLFIFKGRFLVRVIWLPANCSSHPDYIQPVLKEDAGLISRYFPNGPDADFDKKLVPIKKDAFFLSSKKYLFFGKKEGDDFICYKVKTLFNSADVLRVAKLLELNAHYALPILAQKKAAWNVRCTKECHNAQGEPEKKTFTVIFPAIISGPLKTLRRRKTKTLSLIGSNEIAIIGEKKYSINYVSTDCWEYQKIE